MDVECWESESESSLTCLHPSDTKGHSLLPEDAVLIYTVCAPTWEDCMKEHHKRQGWEPYVPMV
jgi:hypothetical protein